MTEKKTPTHIIVTELNKLRLVVEPQILLTNSFPYEQSTIDLLEEHNIGYWCAVKQYHKFIRV